MYKILILQTCVPKLRAFNLNICIIRNNLIGKIYLNLSANTLLSWLYINRTYSDRTVHNADTAHYLLPSVLIDYMLSK